MALVDRLMAFFKYTPVDTTKIREKLPFVHLFGYEKSYGSVHPQDYQAMVDAYKSWVYACANKNATSVAKNKLCLYQVGYNDKKQKEELKKISNHPFLDVINSVNPFSNRYELFMITQIFLELTGNAYWWIPRNNLGVPYMIWNIPAHWMKVVPSQEKFIEGYICKVPNIGRFIPFDEDEIVHFKFPSPMNLYYGYGPTIAAQYGVALNEEIKKWGINFFLNNAQPSGVLTTETSLSVDQYERLRTRWNEKHKGVKNAGKIALLEGGMKYEQTGSNMRDARFELVTREMRDEVLAIFGVPASKLGLSEDVNRANAEANDFTYQKETILPRLSLIEEKLNEKMIPIYDKGLTCRFENPIPQDNEFRLKEKQINISSGITTIDEERAKEGLDPFNLPQTTKPLIPFNLVPAGEEPPQQAGGFGNDKPDDKPKEDKKALTKDSDDKRWNHFANTTAPMEKLLAGTVKRYFELQHKEVMSKLYRYKAFTKDIFASVIFNSKEWDEKLKMYMSPNIRQALLAGLKLGVEDTNSPIDFRLYEPNVLRATTARAEFVANLINDSTKDLLKNAFDEAFKNGETIVEIAKRVDNIYNFSEDFRSKRIAQTEIIGAANEGIIKAYEEAGIKTKKWITARDEKVRDSHQIDGQTVDLQQSFTTKLGTKLNYPCDRSGGAPAEDVIGCRCSVGI